MPVPTVVKRVAGNLSGRYDGGERFFLWWPGFEHQTYIFYALSIPTELNSRRRRKTSRSSLKSFFIIRWIFIVYRILIFCIIFFSINNTFFFRDPLIILLFFGIYSFTRTTLMISLDTLHFILKNKWKCSLL